MKRRTRVMMAVVLMAAMTACSSAPGTTEAAAPSPVAKPAASPAVPQEFVVTGPLVVENQLDVLAQRDGVVAQIYFDTGAAVQKGQLLAKLDDRQLTADHDAAAARARSIEADVKNWEGQNKVQAADAQRAQKMWDAQLITKEQLEHAQYQLVASNYEVERERENLKQAQATERSLQLELEKTRIVAPFAGVVARRYVRVGQTVAKDDRLFWVSAVAPMRVKFTLPERYFGRVKKGDEFPLTADLPGQEKHSVKVALVSPVVDPASGTIEVVADVVTPTGGLRPGMTAAIHLPNVQ